jgi:hypothetical protein
MFDEPGTGFSHRRISSHAAQHLVGGDLKCACAFFPGRREDGGCFEERGTSHDDVLDAGVSGRAAAFHEILQPHLEHAERIVGQCGIRPFGPSPVIVGVTRGLGDVVGTDENRSRGARGALAPWPVADSGVGETPGRAGLPKKDASGDEGTSGLRGPRHDRTVGRVPDTIEGGVHKRAARVGRKPIRGVRGRGVTRRRRRRDPGSRQMNGRCGRLT